MLQKKGLFKKPRVLFIDPDLTCQYSGNFPYQPSYTDYECVSDLDALNRLARKMMSIPAFAFDTETNTLSVRGDNSEFKCVGISISWGERNNYYIPVGHVRDEDLDSQLTVDEVVSALRPVFAREDVTIYGWNLKFDLHVLARIGIAVKTRKLFDGMLASWLCDENTPNGLKENSFSRMGVAQEHFNEATATVPPDVKKRFGFKANSRVTFDLVLIADALPYVLGDAFYTWCCCLGFEKELADEGMSEIYYRMYIPFMLVLFDMEETGVCVDVERLKKMGVDMDADLSDLQYRIFELSGVEFNIGSSQQKAELLFGYQKDPKPVIPASLTKRLYAAYCEGDYAALEDKGYFIDDEGNLFKSMSANPELARHSFGFKPSNVTNTGMPKTDKDELSRLASLEYKSPRKKQGVEMCKLLLEYADINKLRTAFVDGILKELYDDGRAHPSFNQIGTDSGRISCSSPNLQQLPKADEDDKYQIRDVFVGSLRPDGTRNKIIALDYHNLEMVCLTYFSDDENLTRMFAADSDAHGSTAVNTFNLDCTPEEVKKKYPHLRQVAKVLNFALMYGAGSSTVYALIKKAGLDLDAKEYLETYHCRNGQEVAQKFIDRYFDSYSGVARFIRSQKRFAHQNGYVNTIYGRKRRLPDINSVDGASRAYSERLAVNSAIQGTAGDITINAQIRIDREGRLDRLGCKMLLQVHDELVFECPAENVDEAIRVIKHYMEHPFGDSSSRQVPFLRADSGYGDTYQEAK